MRTKLKWRRVEKRSHYGRVLEAAVGTSELDVSPNPPEFFKKKYLGVGGVGVGVGSRKRNENDNSF